jgi:hypothetical protein
MWPPPRNTLQSPGTSIPGKAQQGEPVVGSVPAKTPKPMSPGSVPPEAFDPADTVEHWSDADESNVAVKLPPARKK